jgi:hypothetical protein
MSLIPEMSPAEWTVIATVVSAISGFVWRIFGWLQKLCQRLIDFTKPKIETLVESHNRLLDTLGAKQIETTDHIEKIKLSISGVNERLDKHGTALTRLQETQCPLPHGTIEGR